VTERTIRWCGWAAMLGGAMWATKGLAILITGDQPPLLFEVPLLLFPIGLIGLYHRLLQSGARPGRASKIVVYAALAAALLVLPVGLLLSDPPEVVLGVPIATAALATVAGLVMLGRTARRTNAFPPPWHNLPLAMGVATPFLMTVVGGVLEAINERLLEVPLVVLAAGWIGLGTAIAGRNAAGVAAQGTKYEPRYPGRPLDHPGAGHLPWV
jgi:hypothetical protein